MADGETTPPGPRIVEAPDAPMGAGDPTRRWALAVGDDAALFPGITRPEGDALGPALAGLGRDRRRRALVEVALPVLLTEGAGPHLLDAGGGLVLGLGDHPGVPGARVAMGRVADGERIGLARPLGPRLWEWAAEAVVAEARRLEALDGLAEAPDEEGALAWQAWWRGVGLR